MASITDQNLFAAELYAELAPNLRRIVRHNISAPSELIEDACQLAWSYLLADTSVVRSGSYLGWLTVTASRELLRALRVRAREVSYEQLRDRADEAGELADRPPATDLVELRARLLDLQRLPDRERRLLWLRGLGYGYDEIADQTGDSVRTVERLLRSGRRRASA